MIARIARDTAVACLVIAIGFFIWKRDAASPLGVLGGGLLIGMSFWAIRGTVDARIALRLEAETGRISRVFVLVKFFTRHAIVALAAYGMMVRLHLDPVGLLAGVSSLGVAVGVEALRDLRWRRFL
jgi:ATP synthase I chain